MLQAVFKVCLMLGVQSEVGNGLVHFVPVEYRLFTHISMKSKETA